jgi:hypothetical protein
MNVGLKSTAGAAGKALREIARNYPREYRRALPTLGIRGKNIIAKTTQNRSIPKVGRIANLAPLSDVTKTMRKARGHRGLTMGGLLPKLIRYRVTATRVYVGIMAGGEKSFKKFQDKERRELSTKERHLRHKLRIDDMTYNRPARPVIDTVAKWPGMKQDMVRVLSGRIKSMMEKAAKKARAAS